MGGNNKLTRKKLTHAHFEQNKHNRKATIAFGVALGLAQGSVKNWINTWSKRAKPSLATHA